jgi:hypothetical protein
MVILKILTIPRSRKFLKRMTIPQDTYPPDQSPNTPMTIRKVTHILGLLTVVMEGDPEVLLVVVLVVLLVVVLVVLLVVVLLAVVHPDDLRVVVQVEMIVLNVDGDVPKILGCH